MHNSEAREWLDALSDIVEFKSKTEAEEILQQVMAHAKTLSLKTQTSVNTPYCNTIPVSEQVAMPDDGSLAEVLMRYMRWNVICMVMRAHNYAPELGGHIGTYASTAALFEVGLNYFFRANKKNKLGDLVYFQGHAIEGIYARAYMEGRLDENDLQHFRCESTREGKGLSSYPHPWLMPDFWEFPSVCLGLAPMQSIYQAHFLRYMEARGLLEVSDRHVWMICGDGELNEPESLGALNIAAREKLDNLTFVISCNLQRLDGLVCGNGSVIQEYEGVFKGAGWHVIKVVWSSAWDALFQKDTAGLLQERMGNLVDGEFQDALSKDGAYFRQAFFGQSPELLALVSDLSDEDIKDTLLTGGHDFKKLYAAYAAALAHKGQPTVILAKTVKGFGLGQSGESQNIAHNAISVSPEDRLAYRKRFNIPLSDEQIDHLAFAKPPEGSPEAAYLLKQREALGGFMPSRDATCPALAVPDLAFFEPVLKGFDKPMSTTMGFVRIFNLLLRDKDIKDRLVPITSDEARTFGMEGLFRQLGIYAPFGQQYLPEDKHQLMYYREMKNGQFLEEGITEAGCTSTWIAAATSYANNGVAMIPFFIYYSMFGYQRTGDFIWSAGDSMARGFLIGATAGRTTLSGEGLQHQDGHNYLMFSFVPNCVTYDPAFIYELAVIVQHGLDRMYAQQENVFFYITAMNENYDQPAMPEGASDGILRGLYCYESANAVDKKHVRLLGAGAILTEVLKAKEILANNYGVSADIWSVTSFNELYKDVRAVTRHNCLNPLQDKKESYVKTCLAGQESPVIVATDYIKLVAEQIRSEIDAPYYILGTDGFGRSDTRPALRAFFEVDAPMIAYTALVGLYEAGVITAADLKAAKTDLKIDSNKPEPVTV